MIETMRRDGAWSFALSDTQWNEIQKSSGLPEEARRRIDLEICFYRVFVAEGAASRPQEIKANLDSILKAAQILRDSLKSLSAAAYAVMVEGGGLTSKSTYFHNAERLREIAAAV